MPTNPYDLTGGLANPTPPNPVAGAIQAMGANVFTQNALRDDSMEARVGRIADSGSDLMRRAAAGGLAMANKRGLLNSSMAVGAARGAVLDRALPIASQDSQIAAQHNMAELERRGIGERQTAENIALANRQQREADAAYFGREQAGNIQSRLNREDAEGQMSRLTYASGQEMARLQAQLAQSDVQQRREIEATMERLKFDTDAEMKRLTAAAGFDMARLEKQGAIDIERDVLQAKNQQDLAKVQGTIQSALQAQGNNESIQRMGVELAANLNLLEKEQANNLSRIAATGDQEVRRLLEAANQERETLKLSLASNDRQAMAGAMVNIFQTESALRQALLSNDKIPAAERAAYERSIAALGDPIRGYVNALFAAPAGGAPPPAVPGTGGIGTPAVGGTNWGGETPVAGAPAASDPLANVPVVDVGPMAGLKYQNGKFYDPVTGAQVNPQTYTPPANPVIAPPAGIAPVQPVYVAPPQTYTAPVFAQEGLGGIGYDEERRGRVFGEVSA